VKNGREYDRAKIMYFFRHITEVLKQNWCTVLLKSSLTDIRSTTILGFKPCLSFVDIIGLRLPTRKLRDFPCFMWVHP
jgi:hypothetical protein